MISLFDNFVQKAYADASPPAIVPVGAPNAGTSDPVHIINSLYSNVFDILTAAAAALAVIYLVYSGIQYITAAGNAEKAKAGRTGIINAVIGIVIVVAAYAIIRIGITIGNQINGIV